MTDRIQGYKNVLLNHGFESASFASRRADEIMAEWDAAGISAIVVNRELAAANSSATMPIRAPVQYLNTRIIPIIEMCKPPAGSKPSPIEGRLNGGGK